MTGNFISNTKLLTLITASAIVIGSIFLLQDGMQSQTLSDSPARAVIIDQLYDDYPNDWFHQNATDSLNAAGYEVDIFTTKAITVDFFKKLPSMNYEYIVVRTHGVSDSFKDESVILFTGEKYHEEKYIQEQLFGLVKKASPFLEIEFQTSEHESSDWVIVNDTYRTLTTPVVQKRSAGDYYFVIPPKLVDDSMIGQFPQSTILLGGCNTLSNPSLAKALIKRGASNVIGWDDTVGVAANDEILLLLLTETLVKEKKIDDAIDSIMKNYDWGTYPGTLKHYSEENL